MFDKNGDHTVDLVADSDVVGQDENQIVGELSPSPHQTQVSTLADLAQSDEFRQDLEQVGNCLESEKTSGLQIGEIAAKWIHGRKYHRLLNPGRFAELLKAQTGKDIGGKQIENYLKAFHEHQFHSRSGKRFPHLGVSHLSQIAASRCRSDEERLELAQRANDQKSSVRQIRHIAARLHRQVTQAQRQIEVTPTIENVRQQDGVELLRAQADGSVNCLMLDWQWSKVTWGNHATFPQVHCPDDPVQQVCDSLEIAGTKLAADGLVYLFYTSVGMLDRRIEAAWQHAGLKHAGQLIWQKACGGFMDSGTPLAPAHEHIHILCRENSIPKSACGYVGSVTPKWASPTNAHSGQQQNAIHPHQKPVSLMELLISIATVNGLVVDPFAGSGSAGVAAVRRGCSYLGAELIEQYAQLANRRIALARGENEEVVEAISFFIGNASSEQRAAISEALLKSGLTFIDKALSAAA